MFKKFFVLPALLAALLFTPGCDNPPSPEQVASMIKLGTSTAVALGMTAIPDEVQAQNAAEEAKGILENNVLPILNGDEAGLIAGLNKVLTLEAFDKNPNLAKVKLVLQSALPLLTSKLPPGTIDGQLDKVPADTKAYLIAFFEGANDGLDAYLNSDRDLKPGKTNYRELRKKLAAK